MKENMNNIEKEKNIKNNKSAVLKRIALCIFIIAVLGILFFTTRSIIYRVEQAKLMEELKAEVEEDFATSTPIVEPGEVVQSTVEPTEAPTPEPVVNPYANLFEQNEDMIAWIQIDDTKIDLPIVQTPEDEDKYLLLDFEGNYNVNGTLLMDTDSDASKPSTNIIVHGHNMKSGEMFGDLDLYADETYAKEHEIITVFYQGVKKEYQVMSTFYSQVYKKTDTVFKFYKFFEATNLEEFNDYYENCKQLALFDTGVEAEFGDEFLTLSTCAYQVENGRFVVVAKMINEEELVCDTESEE